MQAIAEAFGEQAVTVTGDTPLPARQAAVDRFQSDPTCLLFVGNMRAAGVGLTLTAASHVVFAELDWTPSNVSQAEDRCHRIGQRDHVLVQHLVLDGSLDATMAHTLIAKQAVMDAALDDPVAAQAISTEPILPSLSAPKPQHPLAGEGWYALPDGRIAKVQRAIYGSGRLYAKVLTQKGTDWSWEYVPGLVSDIDPASALSVEQAASFGKLYGVCGICGRPLTDEESIDRGIGPVCIERIGGSR